jgi:putative flippase GtrA
MSVADHLATRGEHHLGLPPARLKRLAGYAAVGATGIGVDLAVVQTTRALGIHWLLAVFLAYQTAMTWNFALQRRYVWHSTGSLVREYLRYFVVDVGAFGVRAAVVWATLDLTNPWDAMPYVPAPIDPAVPASLLGIMAAVLVGFEGAEAFVFGEVRD